MARIFRKLAQLLDVDLTSTPPNDGDRLTFDAGSETWVPHAGSGGGGAPTDATYITQTANGDLDNEQALSALSTGLVKVTNGTGVLSTATGGTDYANASHQHAGEDITSGVVADARIASTIARDSEVTSAISALSSVYQAKDTTLDTYAGIDPSANVQSVLSAADYAAIRTLLDVPTNAAAILDALIDAKGDLLVGTAADTVARLAAGTDGYVLTADSAQTAGVKWAAAAGAMTLLHDETLGSAGTFDVSSISGAYKHLRIVFQGRATAAVLGRAVSLRFNNDSGSNYECEWFSSWGTSSGNLAPENTHGGTSIAKIIEIPGASSPSNACGQTEIMVANYAGTVFSKSVTATGVSYLVGDNTGIRGQYGCGMWLSTAAINRVQVFPVSSDTFVAGSRLTIYGLN